MIDSFVHPPTTAPRTNDYNYVNAILHSVRNTTQNMSSPFATPKKPATDALLHPPGSAVGIAIAAANEAQGKDGLDSVHAYITCRVLGYIDPSLTDV